MNHRECQNYCTDGKSNINCINLNFYSNSDYLLYNLLQVLDAFGALIKMGLSH